MRRTAVLLGCLGLLLSAKASAELRAYDVDGQYRDEVFAALQDVLIDNPAAAVGESAYGRVQRLPTGQILVDAAPGTHGQIEAVLEAIRARGISAAPRATLHYWVVVGNRGGEGGDTPPILGDVLREVERLHGDLAFRMLGTATLVTESGQPGQVEGIPLRVEQLAYVQAGTLRAEIQIEFVRPRTRVSELGNEIPTYDKAAGIEVAASLQPGEFLVLGENTISSDELDGTLFYIVHWPE